MANQEHLDILKRGADAWNMWRMKNMVVWPNLYSANLTGVDLQGANLSLADLGGADLDGADLTRVYLTKTDLRGANLRGSILQEAVLQGANLTRANLSEANVQGAYLGETTFAATYFADATGLDQCFHDGPSVLDHRTLDKNPNLPLAFLRGCGLSDLDIEVYKLKHPGLSSAQVTDIGYKIIELRSDPAIQFHSCFISYSSQDEDFARRLHADLQDTGVRCWFAPEDLKIGDEIRPAIDSQIRLRDKLLLILSEQAIGSEWVKDEVEAAYEEEQRRGKTILFPIRLDDAVLDTSEAWAAKLRRQRHIGDFTRWKDHDAYRRAFERLLQDLRAGE